MRLKKDLGKKFLANGLKFLTAMQLCVVLTVVFSSCFEELKHQEEQCENRMIRGIPSTSILSKSDLDEIIRLFRANNLDYSKFYFDRFIISDLNENRNVRCHEYVNNLKVLNRGLIFNFSRNADFLFSTGAIIGKIDLDTIPSLAKDDIVEVFKGSLSEDMCIEYYWGIKEKERIIAGCFELEFGYYALDEGNNFFTKAWKILPDGKNSLFAYISDCTSEVLYYQHGFSHCFCRPHWLSDKTINNNFK